MRHSSETKNKIRKALTGNKNAKGHITSDDTRKKISLTKIGSKNPNFGKHSWNKGIKMSDISRKRLSESRKGYIPWNKGVRGKCSRTSGSFVKGQRPWNYGKKMPSISGDKSHLWRGGKSSSNQKVRSSLEYKLWRRSVFERDHYACVWCGAIGNGKNLEADHIKPFSLFPELRFAIDNGRTLCSDCHKRTSTYLHRCPKTRSAFIEE